jgi:hypothetical protein
METYEFTVIVEGDLDDEQLIMNLYDRGCEDASFGMSNGVGVVDFAREADNLLVAVITAIGHLQAAGLKVRRVEPDDLVTIPEIAERLGRTPESVRLLANGERGGGRFPLPVSHLVSRNRLWRWSDVARWTGNLPDDELRKADILAAVNATLELTLIAERDHDTVKTLVNRSF